MKPESHEDVIDYFTRNHLSIAGTHKKFKNLNDGDTKPKYIKFIKNNNLYKPLVRVLNNCKLNCVNISRVNQQRHLFNKTDNQPLSRNDSCVCVLNKSNRMNNMSRVNQKRHFCSKADTKYHEKTLRNDQTLPKQKNINDIPGPKGIYALPYIGFRFLFKPFCKYVTFFVLYRVVDYPFYYIRLVHVQLGVYALHLS